MNLLDAILSRLRHVNDWRGPGELVRSVNENCKLCVREEATVSSVKDALDTLTRRGLVESDRQGKWRALPEGGDLDREEKKRLLFTLSRLLKGTRAGRLLVEIGEGL